MNVRNLALALVVVPSLAFAQEAAAPSAGEKAAGELVTKYLAAVKAKKWPDAKKLIHPDTHKAIAERKKRLGKEDHPMAPWASEKTEYYLKEFKIVGTGPGPNGTFIVETSEDNYQVEDKGIAEGEMSTYLVGKKDGKWWIADKKRGETFTTDSIKYGYKGYFDKPPKTEEAKSEEE